MVGGLLQCAMKEAWRLVVGNPRRTMHAAKVGLALAITSATVLEESLYGLLGDNAIWSVMSVVVVFELTAGATIYKGLNRAFGTLSAGILALGVEYLADFAGPIGEPYVVALSILIIGTISTYIRFCEPFKSNYDYGVMIFLLTFSLIIISSYRVANYNHLAVSRFLNIILGGAISLLTNMLIRPIWASEDLHNTIWTNFRNLAESLEGFAKEYTKEDIQERKEGLEDDPIYDFYNLVLSSKHNEESLANFATWEPRWKCKKGVWKQYVKVGGKLRYCTYIVASLHGCLISNMQALYALQQPLSTLCEKVAMECVSLLNKMGENIENKERGEPKEVLLEPLKVEVGLLKILVSRIGDNIPFTSENLTLVVVPARGDEPNGAKAENFQSVDLSTNKEEIVQEILAVVTIAYLLIELVSRLSDLIDSVKLLEKLASFKEVKNGTETPTRFMVRMASFDNVTVQTTD